MAELKRNEDQLTTADLAGRTEMPERREYDAPETAAFDRPKPVRSETEPWVPVNTPTTSHSSQVVEDPMLRDDRVADIQDDRVADTSARRSQNDFAPTPLFSQTDVGDLRERWTDVQTGFVDEPRHAVEEADKLVAAVMQRLAEGFANERANLEKQWDRGDNVSTEDLRVAMQRYRSFFDRLLNA
jgi:hypothetical protein